VTISLPPSLPLAPTGYCSTHAPGGDQIEYQDQDPRIHPLWLEEMRRNGVTPRMDKYFPEGGKPVTEAAE